MLLCPHCNPYYHTYEDTSRNTVKPGCTISPHKVFRILLTNLARSAWEIFRNTGAADRLVVSLYRVVTPPATIYRPWWLGAGPTLVTITPQQPPHVNTGGLNYNIKHLLKFHTLISSPPQFGGLCDGNKLLKETTYIMEFFFNLFLILIFFLL